MNGDHMEFDNFREIVKRYLTLHNTAKQYEKRSKEIKAEIDEIIKERVEMRKTLKVKVDEQKKQMEAIEPYIMQFMKKNDLLNLNTRLGNIKYKESNCKKRVTKEVIKERIERIFDGHENREQILQQIFDTEERETKKQLKCV